MEAHLAPMQPTQVNKITSSCEICSGPHDTQYCMENPEQAFVENASSRTDEAKGLVSNFMASQDARLSKFEANFKQQQSEMTNKIDTLKIRLLEEKDHASELADGTESFPVGIVRDVEVQIGRLKLLNDFYEAKIEVGEGITRSIFRVKETDPGEEETPYLTTLGKRESYKQRPSSDGVGAQTPYYARKEFMDCHLPGEWEIARDAEFNPFKDVLVFRRMVEFLRALPINLKGNMWESEDLIENRHN
ncbi:hypothetical protein Tco_1023300 [Tanacetum coccineum]